MTSKRFGDYDPASALDGGEVALVVQNGETRRAEVSLFSAYASGTGSFLLPANNLSDVADDATAVANIGAAYTVATLADLKALTARPAIVFPQGQSTFNDGWGSPFGWVAGSATAADDVLVVAPTSGEAGRYKRLNSVLYSLGMSPIFTGAYIGPSQKFGAIIDFTAANAAGAETGAVFNMTSAVGSADITTYYKSALAAVATVSSGSASGWAQSNVVNIGAGGTKRGGIVMEADLNNDWGNYTGVPANPYAANFFATGTNTGGYSSAAFIAAFSANGNPMWNYGAVFQGATAINTATIADLTSTATSILITGAHNTAILDWSGATTVGYQISGVNFSVDSTSKLAHAGTSTTNYVAIESENLSTANNTTKSVSHDFYARDTINSRKLVGRVSVVPSDANWAGGGTGGLVLSPETGNGTVSEVVRITHGGDLWVNSLTAVGAGASTQAFVKASSTADLGVYYGTGDPGFTAARGSLYSKTDATTTTTRLWVNTDGGTTWAYFTSSA